MIFDIEKNGTIQDNTRTNFSKDDEATFDGELVLTDLEVSENDELVASGRLRGALSGSPAKRINETFENLVLGTLDSVLSPDKTG